MPSGQPTKDKVVGLGLWACGPNSLGWSTTDPGPKAHGLRACGAAPWAPGPRAHIDPGSLGPLHEDAAALFIPWCGPYSFMDFVLPC